MSKKNNDSLFEDLFAKYSKEEIFSWMSGLYQRANDFLSNGSMPQSIYLNKTIYLYCWKDILEDMTKTRRAYDIKSKDDIKIYTYTATWWIRRKPFQHKEDCEEKFLYVNENFAASILLQASSLYNENTGNYTVSKNKVVRAVEPLMQHLKYDIVTPQTLELFLKGLDISV